MSCRVDNLRVPYGRTIEAFPRHCVLVGTSNEQEFLADPTGDRRFWVVPVNRRIDCKLLAQERDQIWAAAVALYRQGEQWWLTLQEEARSQELNRPFPVEDPWTSHIRSYVDSLPDLGGVIKVRTKDILENCLQLDKSKQKRADQMQVTGILKRLGFEKDHDSKGNSFWYKALTPLIPTDTSIPEVSVPSNNVITTVSSDLLIPTDTFSLKASKDSEAVASQFEKTDVNDLNKQVSEVSVGIRNSAKSTVSTTDTSTKIASCMDVQEQRQNTHLSN